MTVAEEWMTWDIFRKNNNTFPSQYTQVKKQAISTTAPRVGSQTFKCRLNWEQRRSLPRTIDGAAGKQDFTSHGYRTGGILFRHNIQARKRD
jgi:hypothetical protein